MSAGPRSLVLLLAASAVLGKHANETLQGGRVPERQTLRNQLKAQRPDRLITDWPESGNRPGRPAANQTAQHSFPEQVRDKHVPLGGTQRDPDEEALFSLGALGSSWGRSPRRVLQGLADCPDLNRDGVVNVGDILMALAAFGGGGDGDTDEDGDTDVTDLLVLLGKFGQSCSGSDGPRTCAPPFAGVDHPCRGDHSYVGAVFVDSASSAAACQAACLADAGCTGGSFFDGDEGTQQWRGTPRQAVQDDGCHLYGAAGAWAHFDVCPEHWSIYSNPAVSSFECASVREANAVYPYMVDDAPQPECGTGFYLNPEWNRNPPDWFHRSVVSGVILRDFGSAIFEDPIPDAWPCWICMPGSFPAEGCSTRSWYHGDTNRNKGWNSPIPTRFEPCCEKCAMNTYDHDMDPTTACAACPAGKRTYATGSGDCFMEKCPSGECGASDLATDGAADTLDVACTTSSTPCVLDSWSSADVIDSRTGNPVVNANGETFTLYKLAAQSANTFYTATSTPNGQSFVHSGSDWTGEQVGMINYCTYVDPEHKSCDPGGEITSAARRYADLCFAAGLQPVSWGEETYYPYGDFGYTTCDLMYNCLPLTKSYVWGSSDHGTMRWIATVTGWDNFMTFFPSSGAPPASANLLANYNSATYDNEFGVDYGYGWQREEPWDQEFHPICGKLNSEIEDLPLGIAIGRPFTARKTAPVVALLEEAASDWGQWP